MMNEKRGKNLSPVPAQLKGRSSSASDIPEDSPITSETKPQIPKRPMSESDLAEANAQRKATFRHWGHFKTLCNLNEHFRTLTVPGS